MRKYDSYDMKEYAVANSDVSTACSSYLQAEAELWVLLLTAAAAAGAGSIAADVPA
jgi:hypothetical protein